MERGYGQHCPVAKGAEVFAERWTPLIIRNLHLGCRSSVRGGRARVLGCVSRAKHPYDPSMSRRTWTQDARAGRATPARRLIRQYRPQLVLLVLSSLATGVLTAADLVSGRPGMSVGALAPLVVFATAVALTLIQGARELIATREAGVATGETATELQALIADRLPSLLEYLGRLADAAPAERERLIEGMESLVVSSAASLYGRSGLRAVVLHLHDDTLQPGNYRPGWSPAIPAALDEHSRAGRRAFALLANPGIVWVDDPNDSRHFDQLALRSDDSYQSFIRVPIIAGERAFGLLWVDGREIGSLTEADTPALGLLARLLGTAFALGGHEYRMTTDPTADPTADIPAPEPRR
jgi:GAF domain